jgi:nucleoside-diphosphate-sugar epimerase
MKFHTAVSRFCYQAVTTGEISVWRTALRQKRPYLAIEDAVAALEMAALGSFANDLVVNVATTTSTVETIIQEIRRQNVTVSVRLVDSQIMNEDSFEMRIGLAMERGFCPLGSLQRGISTTIAHLKLR